MSHQLTFARLAEYDPGHPSITVTARLGLGKLSVKCETKIDTGATYCIFARRIGEELGLDVESGGRQLISTATGVFLAFRHDVTLEVEGFEFDVSVCFAADEAFNRNVLGRHGFLDRMRIGVVDYEGKLYLDYYEG